MRQSLTHLKTEARLYSRSVFARHFGRGLLLLTGLLMGQMAWGQSPGGVSANLRIWLKAHDGFTPSSWTDRSGAGNNFTQTNASRQPFATAVLAKYNYYPAVDFGNTGADGRFMVVPNGRPYTADGMASSIYLMLDRKTSTTVSGYHDYIGFGNTGTGAGLLQANTPALTNGTSNSIEVYPNGVPSDLTGMSAQLGRLHMEDASYTVGSGQTTIYGHDGRQQSRTITFGAAESQTASGGVLGAQVEEAQALMTEVICFERALTGAERDRVRSYLALKYGITLSSVIYGQYLNSSGTQIYSYATNTGYNANIFGLVRDDGSGLNQKISRSINDASMLVIGTNDMSLPLSNLNASRTSLTNGQSFIVGDNDAAASAYTSTTSCGGETISQLNRAWKAQNIGSVGVLYFTVNLAPSGINQNPKMIITGTGGAKREVAGTMNADGTATFATKIANGETFTFGGIRFSGTCATCVAGGFGTFQWKTSGWVAGANGPTTSAVAGAGLNATFQFLDPEAVENTPTKRPNRRGKSIQLDRKDQITPTGTANGGAYTSTITLNNASKADFVVQAIDKWGECRDIVEIKGYCGATSISPVLSYTLAASKSSYTISGNIATANNKWSGYWYKRGMLQVRFDRPVNKIEVIWKTDKAGNKKRFQRLGISDVNFTCPELAPDPCLANADNVLFTKKVDGGTTVFPACENVRFKYTLTNQDCAAKTVNITDELPAGMTWVDESFEDGSLTAGTANAYANTTTFSASGVTVGAGSTLIFYVSAKFTNNTAASYGNRASMTVTGGTAGTIQSSCANTTWSSTVSAAPYVPSVTYAVNNACYGPNATLIYTVTFNNTSGSAATGQVFSTAVGDQMTIAGNISNLFGGTANDYVTEDQFLEIENMTIPVGTSSFTFTVNTNSSNTAFDLSANLSADPNADCAPEAEQNSNVLAMTFCNTVVAAPGGVAPGLVSWFKENAANNGTTWKENGSTNNATGTATYNTTGADLINFNPSYSFNGSTNKMTLPTALNVGGTAASNYTLIGVGQLKGTVNRRVFGNQVSNDLFGYYANLENTMFLNFTPSFITNGANGVVPATTNLNNFVLTRSAGPVVLRKNGTQTSSNLTSSTSTWQAVLGGDGIYSENSAVTIPEFISYNTALSAGDVQKVESYLGIKYGFTYTNDYVNSDGISIYTLGSYASNVFGIGRDDASGLVQKQSKSANSGFQPIIATIGFAATNADNASGFATDKSFVVAGCDNGSANFGTPITAPSGSVANNRFTRIWKVQETGTVGTVKFAIPQVGTGGVVYLLRSTDATFDATDTWTPLSSLTVGGNTYLAGDIDFNNGDYFTIATYVSAPGCVTSIKHWLRADNGVYTNAGTTNAVQGDKVQQWNNASGSGFNVAQATLANRPTYTPNTLVNFNPSVTFTRANTEWMQVDAPFMARNRGTMYVAARPTMVGINYMPNGFDPTGNYPSTTFATDNRFFFYPSGTLAYAPQTATLNQPYVIGATWDNGTGVSGSNTLNLRFDGNSTLLNSGVTNVDVNPAFDEYRIGGDTDWGSFDGQMNELLVFETPLTAAERDRVDSYLAIKYGVQLAHNYLSGSGSTIYDIAAYGNNVFGIGRDDCQSLNQKQSKSAQTGFQPILSTTGFAASNTANTTGFGTDATFLMAGSDNGAASFGTPITAPSGSVANNRFTRIWKVQETGTVGTVKFAIPQVGTGGVVYLLRSTDATFDATDTWTALSSLTVDGNTYLAGDVDFANGDYFTIATFVTAPGCVAGGLQYWFDANTTVTGTNADVTGWSDKFSAKNLTKSASGTLGTITKSVGDGQSNYNPFVTFPNNAHITGTVDPVALGRLHTTFAVAQKDANIDGTYNHPFRFGAGPGAYVTHDYAVGTHLNGAEHYATHHWLSKGGTVDRMNTAFPIGLGTVGIYGARINSIVSGNNKDVSFNGSTVTYSDAITGDINANMQIGGSGYGMQGRVSEVIYYNTPLSNNERDRVNTYLGIKYGISLNHNYLSGTSATIYDTTGFAKNIFGIGREDCQSLNQKQAKSVNATAKMIVGLADSISATNATHPATFTNDAAFTVIGDNGLTGVVTPPVSGACPPPPSADKASAQKFKVVETGSVQSIKVQFDPSGLGFNNLYPVYMQIASDSNFTSLIANVPMQWSGSNVATNYDFAANATSYVRFMGNTTVLANICTAPKAQTFYFNGWNYGVKTKTTIANYGITANAGDMVMKTTVTDGTPNILLYRPNVDWWPVFDGYGLFYPRWGSSANENSTITTKIEFLSQATTGAVNASATKLAAQTADFMIWDLDGYIGSRDIVKVYGKLGANTIDAKLTRNKYTALTTNHGGDPQSVIGGVLPWDLSYWGRLYVAFESPVEEIYIEYKQDATYGFNSYQDFRLGPITATCKAPTPEVVTPDNIYMFKDVQSPVKAGENAVYKFTLQNLNCGDKVINISDILPAGLTWADSSLATTLTIGSTNNYGNGTTMTLGSVTVPAGVSYIYAEAKTTTAGTFNNQATFTVGANNYLSDDPSTSGANNPTPVTVIGNDPEANLTIAKTVNTAAEAQNGILTYTITVTNPNASAVTATVQDNLPPSSTGITPTYVAASLTGASGATVSPYGGESSLTIRDLSIPANGSVTLTVQANVGSFTIGDTIKNIASVVPDVSAGYRLTNKFSASAETKVTGGCVAGSAAPTLSTTTHSNACPAVLANLGLVTATNQPVGTVVTWHTATPATLANKVADSANVSAGTYYAVFYDAAANCFSNSGNGTTVVTVTLNLPCPTSPGGLGQSAAPVNGVEFTLYSGYDGTLSNGITGTVKSTGYTNNLTYTDDVMLNEISDNFSLKLTTNLSITTAGTYQFRFLNTDDQTYMLLDGTPIITGTGTGTHTSGNIALTAGMHSIEVRFSEGTGSQNLNTEWRGTTAGLDVGTTFEIVSDARLFITPKLTAWYKADAGTTGSNGNNLTAWTDQSTFGNNLTMRATHDPKLHTTTTSELMNFNPSVKFTDDQMQGADNSNGLPVAKQGRTMFSVFNKPVYNTGEGWLAQLGKDVAYEGFGLTTANGRSSVDLAGGILAATVLNHLTQNNKAALVTGMFKNGNMVTTDNVVVFTDGTQKGMGSFPNSKLYLNDNEDISVGHGTDLHWDGHDGNIAEVILFPWELSQTDRFKVESYLGIKYGITVGHNYLSSTGTTVYDTTGFSNFIFGIGRDDAQSLNQKQSKASDLFSILTIGNGSTDAIQATNAANTNNFTADNSFEIIGDNGLTVGYTTNYTPSVFTPAYTFKRMARLWKVQETGTVGTITLKLKSNASHMIVDTDGDGNFATGAKVEVPMTNGQCTYNFTNGQIFTFGREVYSTICNTGVAYVHGDDLANSSNNSTLGISAWRSNGDGTFSQTVVRTSGFNRDNTGTEVFGDNAASATYAADVDNDGDKDLVHVSEDNSNSIYVYKNNANGTFQTTPIVTSGFLNATSNVFAGLTASEQGWMGDANNDGKVDYIFSGNDSQIHVYLGNGDGTFALARITSVLNSPSANETSGLSAGEQFLVADVNGDGSVDLVGTYDPRNLIVYLGNGDGTFIGTPFFQATIQDSGSSNASGSAQDEFSQFADVDGDGDLDYVHAEGQDGTAQIWAYLNNGDGTFQTNAVLSQATTMPLGGIGYYANYLDGEQSYFADVNGDGKADFITTRDNGDATTNGIAVYLATSGGSFAVTPITTIIPTGFATGTNVTETSFIDCGFILCNSGNNAPTLSATTKSNTCPATTVNLSTITASNLPVGAKLTWHTATPATLANKVADSTAVATAGTYYAAIYDFTNDCIAGGGAATTAVTVSLKLCTSTPPVSTPIAGSPGGGSAGTELNPIGGTAPYTYSNGSSDPACVAPVGASPLPASSNLVVNSNGTYTYTVPTTVGNYYFCIKVCDNSTPTPICTVVTYPVNVACGSGTAAPTLSATTATNTCPTTTANLSTITASNMPVGAKLTWHTATPATLANKVADSTAVTTGVTYYAAFHDFTNGCFGNGGNATTSVSVTTTTCSSCNAGTSSPVLSATTATNSCPTTTTNLSTITASNLPAGVKLTWHTATPATLANKVADSTAVAASGTYYAAFTDFVNGCIGNGGNSTASVAVSLKLCTSTPPVSTPPAGGTGGGNAGTELNPIGGNAPYTYSNGSSDPACVAPVGANPLPASSNLVVNSNGTYTYTVPTTVGNYYFCIKVCDNSTPTPICTVATYPVNVACGSGTAAPTLSASTATNTCPTTTANLSTITASNMPAGARLTWHTATPTTLANKVADSTAVTTGVTYYAAFHDFTNGCFGNGGNSTTSVTTTTTTCGAPDVTTTIYPPSPALVVNQVSNLPVSVKNIGGAAAPGVITTTISLPVGVTAPPTFTTNGSTCSTSGQTVTCTNPGPIAPNDSILINVPITPDASTAGSRPIFNANTNPVTGETATGNNPAAPLQPANPVVQPVSSITSSNNFTYAESGTTPVATIIANGTTPTYSITGGADAALFSINPTTGVLTFNASPDFENPLDAGANNVYDIVVQATNAGGSATQNITITVTDGPECAGASVGGTVGYTGGVVCSSINVGSLTLSGNTGAVVKWQTSTNSGASWTDIANTSGKNAYNFVNAINGQQFRAVINNGASCADANATPATIATSATVCEPTTCSYTTGSFSPTVTPPAGANLETRVILVNNRTGIIEYATAAGATAFSNVESGKYLLYALTYDNTQLPLPTTTVGTHISAIGGVCVTYSDALATKVCRSTDVGSNGRDDDNDDLIDCHDPDNAACACNYASSITVFNPIPNPSAAHVKRYVLTDSVGRIVSVSNSATFSGLSPRQYRTYVAFFDPIATTNPLTVGADIDNIYVPSFQVSTATAHTLCANSAKYDVKFELKGFDCTTKQAVIRVRVRANSMTDTFRMGDANYRFDYDPRRIHTPTILSQENYSSLAPATHAGYGVQDLTGSSAGATIGTVSLNTTFSGTADQAQLVDTAWKTVACIGFTATDTSNCFDLIWHNETRFPVTGVSGVVQNGATTPQTYQVTGVGFDNLNYCWRANCACAYLDLKVLLEGPFQSGTGLMTTVLNQRGLLPGQTPIGTFGVATPAGQPYNTAPWNYAGTESTTTYPTTVTDWVLVSLRTDSTAASTVARKAGLLHNNGTVTFLDSCWSVNLALSYYIVVEHRNHMGVMSATARPIVTSRIGVDFTAMNGFVLNNPPSTGQKLVGTKYVMLAGDGQNTTRLSNYDINFQDSQLWRTQSGIFDCYKQADHNLDADVNFQDSFLWKQNNGKYSGVPHN